MITITVEYLPGSMNAETENPGKPGTSANGIQTQAFSGKCFQIKEHQKINCLPRGCLTNYPSICPAKLTFSIRARMYFMYPGLTSLCMLFPFLYS